MQVIAHLLADLGNSFCFLPKIAGVNAFVEADQAADTRRDWVFVDSENLI